MEKRGNWLLRAITAVILCCALVQGAVAEEMVTVGATVPATAGPPSIVATAPELEAGLKDCLDLANQEGGINGKKLRFVMGNDQYNGEVAKKVFEELVLKYHPLCMFGSGTPPAVGVMPLLRDRHKVLYTSTSFSAKLVFNDVPSMFLPGPTYGDQVAVALKHIARIKQDAKVAFFYSQTPFGEDPIPYGRIMSRRLRLKLVGEVSGDIRGTDFTAQIEELKSKGPDFVIIHGWVGRQNAALIKQCHDLGLKSEFVTTIWGATKDCVEALGPAGPQFLAVSPYAYWWMEDVPMIKTIRAYTAKHYPEVTHRSLMYMVAFTAGKVFVECLRKADAAGELDGAGVTKALQSLKDLDTGGLTPPLTIKENRFPVARILKSNPVKGILEPASDWIHFY